MKRESTVLVVEGLAAWPPDATCIGATHLRVEIDTKSGTIASVGPVLGNGDLVLDDEHLILPGIIDLHVHAREDVTGNHSYKETFETAGAAAVHGGVTAIAEMPNNPSPPVDDDTYAQKERLARKCPVDVLLYAGVAPGTLPLSRNVPYKVYVGPSVGGVWFNDADVLERVLSSYVGQRVAFHAELPETLRRHRDARTHAERRPADAEVDAIDLVLRLSEQYDIEPHICHLSTAQGLDLVRQARRRGLSVTCEVTPHHLYFDEANLSDFWSPRYLQVNPPIRTRADRLSLLDALRSDEIDYLATDHAPHTIAEKENGTSGITHLDTVGPFLFWLLDQRVSLNTLVRCCAVNPGRFMSRFLPGNYGRLEVGCVGSLTILSRGSHPIRREELQTRAGWSPFEGLSFGGSVSHTIVRGQVFPSLT